MCGVIGIYSQNDVSKKLFYGLNSLQHRGQEASGICVFNGEDMILDKGMGLVYDNFDDESFLKLKGNVGIGHVRYATAGGSYRYNSQPLLAFSKASPTASSTVLP